MKKGLHKLKKQIRIVWSNLLACIAPNKQEKISLYGFVNKPLDERVIKQSRAEIINDLDAKINRWSLES